MNKGQLLARGRTAEVFSWSNDQVFKLFHSWFAREWIDKETSNSKVVSEKELPTPRLLDIVVLEDLNQYLCLKPKLDKNEVLEGAIPIAVDRLTDGIPEEENQPRKYIESTLKKIAKKGKNLESK